MVFKYIKILFLKFCIYFELFPIIEKIQNKFSWKVYYMNKQSNDKSRLGVISTPHGKIYTPAFIFCATKATMKTTTTDYVESNNSQIILSNTYHLFLKGYDTIKKLGGLHKAIGWNKPMLTDSGGYQVFAMNHMSVSGDIKGNRNTSWQPTLKKVTEDYAEFINYYDKSIVRLSPEKSIEVQKDLGADLVVVFDECTSNNISKKETKESMIRSHQWEKRSYNHFNKINDGSQALYGIVQGGTYLDLRKGSCTFNNNHEFFGTAVGGCLGDTTETMYQVVKFCMENLRKDKPVHLLGIGYLADIFHGVRQGIDTFDCVHPTRVGRHGFSYAKAKYLTTTAEKKSNNLNINKGKFKDDHKLLEDDCSCTTCSKGITRSYLHLLIKQKELMAYTYITNHNVYFFNKMMEDIREGIAYNTLELVEKKYLFT